MSALLLVARRTAAAPLLTCRTSSTFNLPSRSCRQDETDDVKRARLIYQSRWVLLYLPLIHPMGVYIRVYRSSVSWDLSRIKYNSSCSSSGSVVLWKMVFC